MLIITPGYQLLILMFHQLTNLFHQLILLYIVDFQIPVNIPITLHDHSPKKKITASDEFDEGWRRWLYKYDMILY